MKTKRLIIILSIVAVLVLIVVLSSTVFTLKKVEINFYDKSDQLIEDNNTLNHYSENDIKAIIDSAGFKYGKNMLLIKKKPYIQKLESANPYLKVIGITSKFPNKLVIKAAEREEYYYTQISSGKYAILDGELKLLNIVDQVDPYNYIRLDIKLSDVTVGEFYNTSDEQKIISQVSSELHICTLDTNKAILLFESISLSYSSTTENPTAQCYWLQLDTRVSAVNGTNIAGVKFSIEGAENNLDKKMEKAIIAYNTLLQEDNAKTQTGTIKVYNNLRTVWIAD